MEGLLGGFGAAGGFGRKVDFKEVGAVGFGFGAGAGAGAAGGAAQVGGEDGEEVGGAGLLGGGLVAVESDGQEAEDGGHADGGNTEGEDGFDECEGFFSTGYGERIWFHGWDGWGRWRLG
ncbi:hypothetical protein FEM03_21510 [Phragmitibacter flavus]|uniref:Uncharacterized protein n=1 Tax=Phragmitibacter flavus TaxID=2576071 RepID=A0A5R8K8F8_9BACT|nr:hypothetical protein FEM03_21510 [Phragmitibacter flavus]